MTIRYANDWNQTVTLKDIRFRKGVITEYNNWIKQEYIRQQTEKQEQKKDPKSIVNSLEEPLTLPEGIEQEAQQLVEEINKNNTELKEV
jgi:transcription initiation factor TFIIIB Brf1 subunit/transcription initiation factor TFIIB